MKVPTIQKVSWGPATEIFAKTEYWKKKKPTNNSEGSDDRQEASLNPEPDEEIPAVVRAPAHCHRSVHELKKN